MRLRPQVVSAYCVTYLRLEKDHHGRTQGRVEELKCPPPKADPGFWERGGGGGGGGSDKYINNWGEGTGGGVPLP